MNTTELLKSGAEELGVGLSPGQVQAFEIYLLELVRWNRKVNLTAIERPDEIVVKHFLDSLALASLLPEGPFRAADIGSGAGFPGIPLRIARPDMELTLVEPARKKSAFLRHVVRLVGLSGTEVAEEKVEPFTGTHLGMFDTVFSRAFTEPARLVPLVSPLLAAGGRIVLSLGPEMSAPAVEGWTASVRAEITLPHSDYNRRLTVYARA